MKYVDGFVLVVPKKKLAEYKALATQTAKIWKRCGALSYYECALEDASVPCGIGFDQLAQIKKSETVVFAFIGYKSRKHRDSVNAKIMDDPAMQKIMKTVKIPFDPDRMTFGGFDVMVKA